MTYTLSLHDALPIIGRASCRERVYYTFERSKALRGEQWCGLVVDLDNQSEQAEKKIKAWCQQVKKEFA